MKEDIEEIKIILSHIAKMIKLIEDMKSVIEERKTDEKVD